MNFTRRFLEALILSNAFLSLGIAFTAFSLIYLSSPISDLSILLVVFLMTFSMYSLNRLTDEGEDRLNNPKRGPFVSKYRFFIIALSITAYLLAALIALLKNLSTFLFVMAILIISVSYSVRIVPIRLSKITRFRRLKDLFVGKNLAIAWVWAMTMVFLPLSYMSLEILTLSSACLFMFIFMRSLINTTFFDIRDIKGDRASSVKTIPAVFGVRKTILLLIIFNLIISSLLVCAVLLGLLPQSASILHVSTLYSLVYLHLIGKVNMDDLCDFIVDGEYLVIGLLPLIANMI